MKCLTDHASNSKLHIICVIPQDVATLLLVLWQSLCVVAMLNWADVFVGCLLRGDVQNVRVCMFNFVKILCFCHSFALLIPVPVLYLLLVDCEVFACLFRIFVCLILQHLCSSSSSSASSLSTILKVWPVVVFFEIAVFLVFVDYY